MFKDQGSMHQGYGCEIEVSFREVATVELQTRDPAIPESSSDFAEVLLVDVHTNHPLCSCAVDLFKAVSARYPEHRYTLRKTVVESTLEQSGKWCQLLHAG